MTNAYDYPSDTPVVDERGQLTVPWAQWVHRTHAAAFATQQSGPTAERPTKVLWIGRTYFDTTLGIPVWVSQVKPAVEWVDSTGATA